MVETEMTCLGCGEKIDIRSGEKNYTLCSGIGVNIPFLTQIEKETGKHWVGADDHQAAFFEWTEKLRKQEA